VDYKLLSADTWHDTMLTLTLVII